MNSSQPHIYFALAARFQAERECVHVCMARSASTGTISIFEDGVYILVVPACAYASSSVQGPRTLSADPELRIVDGGFNMPLAKLGLQTCWGRNPGCHLDVAFVEIFDGERLKLGSWRPTRCTGGRLKLGSLASTRCTGLVAKRAGPSSRLTHDGPFRPSL